MKFNISVVVTHYNHNRYLWAALESAANQTLPPSEIIVVDDGSDEPVGLDDVQRNAEIPTGIGLVVIKQLHRGIGAALNAGIRAMTGNVFTWLPADDLWYSHKLEQQAAACHWFGYDCVQHALCEVWEDNRYLRCGDVPELSDAAFAERIRVSSPYYANTFWIPKPILDQVGPFREDVPACEDYQWVLRSVVQHGVRYRLLPRPLAVKRHHALQTTKRVQVQIPELVRKFNEELGDT